MERLREQVTAASEYSVVGKLVGYAVGGYGGVELHDSSVWGDHFHYLVLYPNTFTCGGSFEGTVPH